MQIKYIAQCRSGCAEVKLTFDLPQPGTLKEGETGMYTYGKERERKEGLRTIIVFPFPSPHLHAIFSHGLKPPPPSSRVFVSSKRRLRLKQGPGGHTLFVMENGYPLSRLSSTPGFPFFCCFREIPPLFFFVTNSSFYGQRRLPILSGVFPTFNAVLAQDRVVLHVTRDEAGE